MYEIQMVYRDGGRCTCGCDEYNMQCHTVAGEDVDCQCFCHPNHKPNEIPFGDCIHAVFQYCYKGLTTKTYEMEPFEDPYNWHLNCMMVTVRGRTYDCEKVILNGECIYNTFDENAENGRQDDEP